MIRRATVLLIAFSNLTAVSNWAIYTWPLRSFSSENYWHIANLFFNLAALFFLALPVLSAVFFASKRYGLSYLCLGIFPLVAFLFGLTPVPFGNYLYSDSVQLNNVVIIFVNLLVVALVVYLFGANKPNNYAPAAPDAVNRAGF